MRKVLFKTFLSIGLALIVVTASAQFSDPDCSNSLGFWYVADSNDVNGTSVTVLEDQSSNSLDLSQSTSSLQPTLVENGLNFHSTISFDGVNDMLFRTNVSSSLLRTNSSFSMYAIVKKAGTTGNAIFTHGQTQGRITFETGRMIFGGNQASNIGTLKSPVSKNYFELRSTTVESIFNGVTLEFSMRNFIDGKFSSRKVLGTGTPINFAHITDSLMMGDFNGNTVAPFEGQIAEVLLYQNIHRDALREKFWAYLSLKYGITLDTTMNYRTSESTTYYWDNSSCTKSSYNTRVSGIFRDDCYGVSQIKATNQRNNLLTAALTDDVGSFNIPDNFDADQESFLWGDNNGSFSSVNSTDVPSGLSTRFNRVWATSETGNVGQITFEFDLSPVLATGINSSDIYILIDTDQDEEFSDESVVGGGVFNPTTWNSTTRIGQFSHNFNDCDHFTFGFVSTTPLPVVWNDYKASLQNHAVEVKWSTASEVDNDFFEVQRLNNSTGTWEVLNRQASNGTRFAGTSYSFVDQNPVLGHNYYRIRQVDENGSDYFTDVMSVEYSQRAAFDLEFKVYPNPATDILNIEIPDNGTQVDVIVRDLVGRPVFTANSVQGVLQINVGDYHRGVYLIEFRNGSKRVVSRIVMD